MKARNKITPFLWFDGRAQEAAKFYTTTFKNAKLGRITKQSAQFTLEGQEFIAYNCGPEFKFNEAISFFVDCRTQTEVDELWEKLSAGGAKSRCGWLQDKFGLWWQVIPSILIRLLHDPDPVKAKRVWEAMMQMEKIDIAALKLAYKAPGRKSGKSRRR